MKKLTLLLLSALATAGATAQIPDMVLDFEHDHGAETAADRLGNVEVIPLTRATQIATDDAKIGQGSLLIQPGVRSTTTGWYLPSSRRPEFFGGSPALTLALWLKLDSNEGSLTFVRRGGTKSKAAGSFSFGIDRLHRLVFQSDDDIVRSPVFEVPVDQWFHVAATCEEGVVRLYLDGVELGRGEVSTKNIAALEADGSFSAMLHSRPGNRIDEFTLYGSRALSAEEIANLAGK